jgi:hypothetical protein
MGGGGGSSFEKIITGDVFMPESVKKTSDKLTSESFKKAGNDIGWSNMAMGLPNAEEVTSGGDVVPEVPTIGNAVSQAVAKASAKRSAVARSRSIFTSPLGLGVAADTAKKILLGQ